MRRIITACIAGVLGLALAAPVLSQDRTYKVLATSKTSTMQKEMQEAGSAGYRFVAVMGGETAGGGKETAALLQRDSAATGSRFEYKLLATSKTSTMEKEIRELAELGYQAIGLTVGKTALGGSELVVVARKPK